MSKTPPKYPLHFFRWFCNPEYAEDIEGDLLERFIKRTNENRAAKWLFTLDVLKLFRPGIIRSFEGSIKLNYYGMFKQNIKLGWRNILKYKAFFGINISGLAIGIATCLMILLFVFDELSYDRYNDKVDRIARIVLIGEVQGESIREAIVPPPAALTLEQEISQVEIGTRLTSRGKPLILHEDKKFRESSFAYADPNFFQVFTLPFIQGDPSTALKEPNAVVITKSESFKYFGKEDAIGKLLEFKEWGKTLKVTGVIEDVPFNSHFHFDLFGSMEGWEASKTPTWLEGDFSSYVLLKEGVDISEVQEQIPSVLAKHLGPQLQKVMGITLEQFEQGGNQIGLFLQPLADVHLHSNFSAASELEPGGDINTVYIFSAIALFVLLVACVNFMNLSTAAASRRSKEVGIKKVLGSAKGQLLVQFLTESFLATLAAMMLAPALVVASLPFFNSLSGKVFHASDFLNLELLLVYALFGFLLSILAGAYPAFVLSSFRPLEALKNKFVNAGGKGMRSSLVVFQFAVSTVLIIGAIIVDQQMSFIQNKDIGYDRDGLIVIKDSWLLGNDQAVFKDELLALSMVENVTNSRYIPTGPSSTSMNTVHLSPDSEDFRRTTAYYVDDRYLPTLGIDLIDGRNFSDDYGAESLNIIVNQTFVEFFQLGDNPIGKQVKATINNDGEKALLNVIGVIQDFHFKPLHKEIEPMMMRYGSNSGLIIRAKTADIPTILQKTEEMWEGLNAEEPFSYALMDDLYRETYLREEGVGTLLRTFAILTILVACLGLFGLVTFTTERRIKEIGIRKVLGSSVSRIVMMLTYDFLKLVGISLMVAIPAGYYLMKLWLADFAYRIDLPLWAFILAGMGTIAISWLTVSAKTLKAATANPVDSLKDE